MRFDREGISIPFPQQGVHFHPTKATRGKHPGATEPSPPLGGKRTPLTARDEPES